MGTFDFVFGKKKELISATKKGNLQKVKELIKNGANVNAANEWGTTALSFATIEGHKDIIKILEE